MKQCNKCLKTKRLIAFRSQNAICKNCQAKDKAIYFQTHKAEFVERKKQWIKKNPFFHLKRRLKFVFNISLEDYQNLVKKQNGVCAICHQPQKGKYKKHLSVDHNHKTGKVRGLLCQECNFILGQSKENPAILESARQYLISHNSLKVKDLPAAPLASSVPTIQQNATC